MGTVIHMYAAANPADNMASIDVPANGHLVGVDWAVQTAASGADFGQTAELSFGSTGQITTNDARAAISHIRIAGDITTSGALNTGANKYVALPNLPVNMGERIYLHGSGTAINLNVNVGLHFDFDLDRPRARMR